MTEPTRPTAARINGELVKRAPRNRPDKRRHNEDIAWLLSDSRGELGQQGVCIGEGSGGGDPSDNWPMIERLHGACPAVRKWRRLNAVWVELDAWTRSVLTWRYAVEERGHWEIRGLKAAFGDLAVLAWELGQSDEESASDLRDRLSRGNPGKRDKVIAALKERAETENRAAHKAWLDELYEQAIHVECPRRTTA